MATQAEINKVLRANKKDSRKFFINTKNGSGTYYDTSSTKVKDGWVQGQSGNSDWRLATDQEFNDYQSKRKTSNANKTQEPKDNFYNKSGVNVNVAQQDNQKVQTTQDITASDKYQDLLDAKTKANVSRLEKAYQSSSSKLDEEREGIKPMYTDAKSQTSATSKINAKNFAEFMAQRGSIGSGANAQAEISRNNALQRDLGNLNTQEANAYANIDRRQSDLYNAYQSDIVSTNADLEAQALQNAITQANSDRQYNLQANNQAFNQGITAKEIEQANIDKRNQDFITTIGQYSRDYQAEIDRIANDNDTSNDWKIPFLKTARSQKVSEMNLNPITGQPLPTDNTPELTSSSALALWQQLGTANEAVSRALGIPLGTKFTNQVSGGYSGGNGGSNDISSNTVDGLDELIKQNFFSWNGSSYDKNFNGADVYITNLEEQGVITPEQATYYRALYGKQSMGDNPLSGIVDGIKNIFGGGSKANTNINNNDAESNYTSKEQGIANSIARRYNSGQITYEQAVKEAQQAGLPIPPRR